jgi:hypothetical protein
MTLIQSDDSDLDNLDPVTRARRLKIRRGIDASLSGIGETWYDKEIREKTEARQRREAEAREAKKRADKRALAEATVSAADLDQIDADLRTLDRNTKNLVDAIAAQLVEHRRQRRAELAEENARLLKRRTAGRRRREKDALDGGPITAGGSLGTGHGRAGRAIVRACRIAVAVPPEHWHHARRGRLLAVPCARRSRRASGHAARRMERARFLRLAGLGHISRLLVPRDEQRSGPSFR